MVETGNKDNKTFFRRLLSGEHARLSALLMLIGVVILFFIFLQYRTPIKAASKAAVERFGYPALFLLCWGADVIIQPIPADVVVFGTVFGGANIWVTAFVAGLSSGFGGFTGYFIGKFFGPWRFRRIFGSKLLRSGRNLFRDHGALAIFVAGVTPIPYSAVCWIAGIYKMSLTKVIIASWISRTLRYLLIAWFADMV